MKHTLFSIAIVCLALNCAEDKPMDATAYYDVPQQTSASSTKKIAPIHRIARIDTLAIQSDIETSSVGDFKIFNDTLYFADRFFGYLFRFTKTGRLIDRRIGKGRGPDEVLGFTSFLIKPDGYCFLNSSNSHLSIFDKTFKKERDSRIDWGITRSQKEVLSNPLPSVGDSYEFDYGIPNIFKLWDTGQTHHKKS